MAVYNGGSFLNEQLESIYRQTHQDWRLLIRDNCSTDATWATLEDHARRDSQRIRLLQAEVNGGALTNFAVLLDHADAGYVMFADADDSWFPDKISRTLARMKELEAQHGPAAPLLVHSDLKVANQDLTVRHDSLWRYQGTDPAGTALNRLLVQNTVTGCTTMLNRALAELARPIPRQPGQVVMHDWWIALVAAAFGHIGHVDQPLMLYRQHGRNDTGAKQWSIGPALRRLPLVRQTTLNFRKSIIPMQRQAATFWERYHAQLAPRQAQMVADYAALSQCSPLERRRLILSHGFYRTGVLRNLSMFWRI